MKLFRTSNWQ